MPFLPRMHFPPATISVVAGLAAFASPARAADAVALRTVGDALVVRCVLHGKAGDFPANLIVDLGMSGPVLLQKNVAEGLADPAKPLLEISLCDAADKPVVRLSKLGLGVKQDVEAAQNLTRDHADALEQVPVAGYLGAGAFAGRVVQVDAAAAVLRVDVPFGEDDRESFDTSFESTDAGLRLTPPDPKALRVVLATRQYETIALDELVRSHHVGTDQATPLQLGPIDLARYSALRPFKLPDGIVAKHDAVLGVQAVSCLRLTIDFANKRLRLKPVRQPEPVAAEQIALLALRDKDTAAIERYLREHESTWLWPQLASALLKMRMDDPATPPDVLRTAMDFYARGIDPVRRSTYLLAMIDFLLDEDATKNAATIAAALDAAQAAARSDVNAAAVFAVNARRGLLALRSGDTKQARRLLLSAAFGLRKDARVALWLGEVYEKSRQPSRAWAQYMKAVLAETPPKGAAERLTRLTADPKFRKTFHATDAEMLLEGTVPAFSPNRARPADEMPTARLVEFFADPDNEKTNTAQLAFDGLRDYFAGTPVVFVAHHFDTALKNDVATERRTVCAIKKPGTLLVDGTVAVPPTAKTPAEQFGEWRTRLMAAQPATAALPVQISAKSDRRQASVRVQADATQDAPAVIEAWLVERCVIAPTKGGLPLHYAVIRRPLTPTGGQPWSAGAPPLEFSIDLEPTSDAIGLDLASVIGVTEYLDPQELEVVAVLHDPKTQAVYGVGRASLAAKGGR